MKAAVCRAFGQPLHIEEVDLADPDIGEIQVRVAACAVCHSDIHYAEGAWGGALPAIYGHEAAGEVISVGGGIDHIASGDHVVVTLIRACGHCRHCVQGDAVICAGRTHLDNSRPLSHRETGAPIRQGLKTGAFAEYVTVDASQAVVIPKDIPMDSASLLACGVITGLGAVVNTARVPAGALVGVVGVGGVGLNTVQGARIAGAARIIAVDINDWKLQTARDFGATDSINTERENIVEAIGSLTGGEGVDYLFITVGAPSAFADISPCLARGGTAVLVGMPGGEVTATYHPVLIANDCKRIIGSKMGNSHIATDIPWLIDLYRQGRLKLDELITRRYGLSQINEAFDDVKQGNALRNVIMFD